MAATLDNTIPAKTSRDLPYTWKRAKRGWGHPLHKLSQYIGSFPPSLARYFVTQLSDRGQVVLDPFCGGGTSLLESVLTDRQAIGSDTFYYAYTLSRAKVQPLALESFRSYLRAKISQAQHVETGRDELENPQLLASYSPKTLAQIVHLRAILKGDDSREAVFAKGLICGILHGPSKMFLSLPQKDTVSSTPGYVRRFAAKHNLRPPERDLYECALNKAQRTLNTPLPTQDGQVYLTDSRDLNYAPSASVDLILTSPPYLSVLDYSWNNWIRLWWLGRDRRNERAKLMLTGREEKYREFIRNSLAEMYRVLRSNSAAVIVVGDVRRRNGPKDEVLNSALMIWEEAKAVGFRLEALISDIYDLHSRSMLVYNSLKWSYSPDQHAAKSSVLVDRCLVLRKGRVKWRNAPIDWHANRNGQISLDF